jgi:hypothetical protein
MKSCHATLCQLLLAAAAPALAAGDQDALDVANRAADKPARVARDWQLSFEAGLTRAWQRDSGAPTTPNRGRLELRVDTSPAPDVRFVLADHLDLNHPSLPGHGQAVNSLKEAYVSWQPQSDRSFDLGRVNVRSGVAVGYNPTDWLRENSLRGDAVADPQRLRSSRLGTVLLRGQALWDGGAFSALAAPRLATQPRDGVFEPDFAATNDRDRALLTVSQRWGARLNQQALLYIESERATQLGLNTSALLSDSITAFVEWAGGRDTGGPDDTQFRSRLSLGATYTTADKLSLSTEFQHNGAGLDAAAWQALPLQSPAAYASLIRWVARAQEMPTRSAWFGYATWQDWPLPNVDLTALLRHNREDGSRLAWFEWRWHAADRMDIALQLQSQTGHSGSEYAALPQRRMVTGVLKLWF